MKLGILSFVLLLSTSAFANETRELKYSCLMNKSETLKVYETNNDGVPGLEVGIDNFLVGEKIIVHLDRPYIVNYGGIYSVIQNNGRSGYFFLRFEDGKKASPNDMGNALGMIDDNLFNAYDVGFKKGELTVIANCTKIEN